MPANKNFKTKKRISIKQSFFNGLRKNIWMLIASAMIAASLAHHFFSIWEKKALWILLIFLILTPLITWLLSLVYPRFCYSFEQMKTRRVLFFLSAILLGSWVTWQLYSPPLSYQTIIITPLVSQDQQVELLEIKTGEGFLLFQEQALENGWRINGEVLTATQDSQPVSVSFLVAANSPVHILLTTSPQGGELLVSLGRVKKEVNLFSPTQQQQQITFQSQYRSIPNGLFIPILVITDIFSFSLFFLVLFILQEKGQQNFVRDPHEKFLSMRISLLILVILTSLLHLINALAVPLIVDSDSPSYLQGAVHLLAYGNFDGVSMVRGPGSTFLFAPILAIFGRNPWGMKIFLHLIAVGCVLLSFRLGWQLSKKRWVAFSIGFLTMLLPDLYYYANFIMSDLPNIFLVILFSSLLLDALDTFRYPRILLALLVGSFAALLRSENILMLAIGTVCLGVQPGWDWLKGVFKKNTTHTKSHNLRLLGMLLLAVIPALLPLFWWSSHNLKLHGFFGLSNYAGEVLYDGWIYYPEVSGIEIRNEETPSIQAIDYWINKYPIEVTDRSEVPTGWEIFPSLIKAGYSSEESFQLLGQAAWDSVSNHIDRIPDILKLKFRDAFKPDISHKITFPLPGETVRSGQLYETFFNTATLSIPPFIRIQRAFYDLFVRCITSMYRFLVLLSLATLFFSLYRKPSLKWVMLVLIAVTRIFVSNLIGLAMWRYTIAGVVFLPVFAVTSLAVLFYGIKDMFAAQTKAASLKED